MKIKSRVSNELGLEEGKVKPMGGFVSPIKGELLVDISGSSPEFNGTYGVEQIASSTLTITQASVEVKFPVVTRRGVEFIDGLVTLEKSSGFLLCTCAEFPSRQECRHVRKVCEMIRTDGLNSIKYPDRGRRPDPVRIPKPSRSYPEPEARRERRSLKVESIPVLGVRKLGDDE
jgi:hypothetical protein